MSSAHESVVDRFRVSPITAELGYGFEVIENRVQRIVLISEYLSVCECVGYVMNQGGVLFGDLLVKDYITRTVICLGALVPRVTGPAYN